ncbi:MAG: hypothetical protein QXX77_04375 [Candidatus Methanosuratincola sp.]
MTNHNEEVARKIAEDFLASLDEPVRVQITEAQLDNLVSAIRKVLSAEKSRIADQIEDIVGKLRAEVDKPELDL